MDAAIVKLLIPSAGFSRRQDAPIVYDMTTVAYVLRPNFILQKKNIFDGKVKSVVVPKQRAVDIDDIYDFKMAEIIFTGARIMEKIAPR